MRKLRFPPTRHNFTLHEMLGRGTVGVVYEASCDDFDEPVAVKLLHPSVADDPAIVARFEREVVVMGRLDHPNIVRHFGGGMIDGQYFYAMQRLQWGTLKDRIARDQRIPWPQAAAYGAQIASALQHAHNHGVVHRDLKPSNLFFAEDGRLVLGDFGVALDCQATRDITSHGVTVGTFSYMAPEQITADASISGAADLYALGCVLYEMLLGEVPFQGASFAQVWDQHLHREPPRVRDHDVECPEWLDDMVARLMAKRADDRPHNARHVQGFLLENLQREQEQGLELEIPLPERSDPSDDTISPWRWLLATAAIGLLILVAWLLRRVT